jgi:hypothetical protein
MYMHMHINKYCSWATHITPSLFFQLPLPLRLTSPSSLPSYTLFIPFLPSILPSTLPKNHPDLDSANERAPFIYALAGHLVP